MDLGEVGAELSPQAELLYEQLLTAGEVPAQDGPEEAELIAAGLVYYGGESDGLLRPVSRRHGMQVLLDRQHGRLVEGQIKMAGNWRRLTALLATLPDTHGGEFPAGVEPVLTLPEAATKAAELYGSASVLLRATFTATYQNQPTERRAILPPEGSTAEFRGIYDTEFASADWGAQIISASMGAGEQVRVRPTVPTKMIHVDDRIALVAVRSDGGQALLVKAPDLLKLLAEWFDVMWRDPATSQLQEVNGGELTPIRRKVLRQLALGRSDKQIAHDCGITARTVSRHIAAILADLGVGSRFAAGAAASRRGWV